jgi:hypothetical protein
MGFGVILRHIKRIRSLSVTSVALPSLYCRRFCNVLFRSATTVTSKIQSSTKPRSGGKSLKTWQMCHMLLRNRGTNFYRYRRSSQSMIFLNSRDSCFVFPICNGQLAKPSLILIVPIWSYNTPNTKLTQLMKFKNDSSNCKRANFN